MKKQGSSPTEPGTQPPDDVAASRSCPICGKPATPEHAPFCSARCTDVDLNRWLGGTYAIPGKPVETEDEDS